MKSLANVFEGDNLFAPKPDYRRNWIGTGASVVCFILPLCVMLGSIVWNIYQGISQSVQAATVAMNQPYNYSTNPSALNSASATAISNAWYQGVKQYVFTNWWRLSLALVTIGMFGWAIVIIYRALRRADYLYGAEAEKNMAILLGLLILMTLTEGATIYSTLEALRTTTPGEIPTTSKIYTSGAVVSTTSTNGYSMMNWIMLIINTTGLLTYCLFCINYFGWEQRSKGRKSIFGRIFLPFLARQ